jgi:hypothetical protein
MTDLEIDGVTKKGDRRKRALGGEGATQGIIYLR